DVLARAKNTSVEKLRNMGILYAEKGVVRLLWSAGVPPASNADGTPTSNAGGTPTSNADGTPASNAGGTPALHNIWLLTQRLTCALEKGGVVGVAEIIAEIFTSEPEHAKALAYRLFTIAERKGWAQEAYAYNSLVIAWPDVQAKAAELQAQRRNAKQMTMFETMND
ncbi:MAG: hypothetical protein FWG50_05585, partial [Kiritimatiellaeota bacterium]|nr:hypothetical protein [Kiritimatiellota bacterium]